MEKRFFINEQDINDNLITITGEEHNHLANVLRLKIGQKIECFYDNSDLYECELTEITKQHTIATIINSYPNPSNPKVKLTLFQGLPKLDKLELIVQKCSELGVSEIIPFTSQHTIAKPNDNKQERLNKISLSASKQCGTTSILKVQKTITFKSMLDKLKDYDTVIFANEKETSTPLNKVLDKATNVAIVVGSEGGFSSQEIDSLSSIASSITLGKRILRTETASIVLSSLVMYALGELN